MDVVAGSPAEKAGYGEVYKMQSLMAHPSTLGEM